jgi:hypothetical protein
MTRVSAAEAMRQAWLNKASYPIVYTPIQLWEKCSTERGGLHWVPVGVGDEATLQESPAQPIHVLGTSNRSTSFTL